MENTPVVDKVIVPKKNILFEVTTVSKVLAAVLFIILPFVGFWIGMQYGSNSSQIHAVDNGNKTIPENVSEKITDLPQSVPATEGIVDQDPELDGFRVLNDYVIYDVEYAGAQKVEGLDIKSFQALNTPKTGSRTYLLYAKDIDTVVVGDHLGQLLTIAEVEPSTFTVLRDNFALDSKSVFTVVEMFGGDSFKPRVVKIPNADPKTFIVIGSGYAKDKNYVYFSAWNEAEAQIVIGADPATFSLTDIKSYYDADGGFKAKDKNNYFDFGKVTTEN